MSEAQQEAIIRLVCAEAGMTEQEAEAFIKRVDTASEEELWRMAGTIVDRIVPRTAAIN